MVCSDQPKRCDHFRAVITGVIVGALMPDESWLYETPYNCPDCGRLFTEMSRQKTERDFGGPFGSAHKGAYK